MHLTRHTDYAFRLLIYVAVRRDELISVGEIAKAYGISTNHLAKVAQHLIQGGWLKSVRGRGGGVGLATSPEEINLAEVVELIEPSMAIVECFSPEGGCPITPLCSLKHILGRAQLAFMAELRLNTLADIITDPEGLQALLGDKGQSHAED